MYKVNPWRPTMFLVGCVATAVSCYGVYEYTMKLEGGVVSYIVVGSIMCVMAGSLIPPLAESVWKNGEIIKSCLWWLALTPILALIWFSSAERVHNAKAGSQAERAALWAAATRAEKNLEDAKAILIPLEEKEAKAKGIEKDKCNTKCRSDLIAAEDARQKVAAAEADLASKQGKSTMESKFVPPVWLLPTAIDILGFLAIWTGLSGPWVTKQFSLRDKRLMRQAAGKSVVDEPEVLTKPQAVVSFIEKIAGRSTKVAS
jgi:hypothetical protein